MVYHYKTKTYYKYSKSKDKTVYFYIEDIVDDYISFILGIRRTYYTGISIQIHEGYGHIYWKYKYIVKKGDLAVFNKKYVKEIKREEFDKMYDYAKREFECLETRKYRKI